MAFTRTLCGAHSAARLFASMITPALETSYADCFCGRFAMRPDIEAMRMILPPGAGHELTELSVILQGALAEHSTRSGGFRWANRGSSITVVTCEGARNVSPVEEQA